MTTNNMANIKLIVTGAMEKHALHHSLKRVFPTRINDVDVNWLTPRLLNCATSHQLTRGKNPSNPMLALAKAMLAESGIGSKGTPADLVVVLDDVELGNVTQEDVVASHFKAAVNQCLGEYSLPAQARYRGILKERCSFHLLKPMTEAYFYNDDATLHRAGVAPGTVPILVHPTDLEEFCSNDAQWKTANAIESARRQKIMPFWSHDKHPKLYLEHLAKRAGVFYDEVDYGQKALNELPWGTVPLLSTDVPLIRALFQDIADWFGIVSPLGVNGSIHPSYYPSPGVVRSNLLLRNM